MRESRRTDRATRIAWGAALLVACALGWSCGGGDEAESGATERMQAPAGLSEASDAGPNSAPVIENVRFEPERPRRGRPVRARVDAHDPDGDPITLSYLWSLEGDRVPGDAQVALPHSRKGDLIELRVTASDGRSESRPEEASTRVRNQPPKLKGVQIEPANRVTAGTEISVRPAAVDPDGDAISYRYTWWVNDVIVEGDGPLLGTKRLRRGDSVRVRVVASDGQAESDPIASDAIFIANAPPVIVSKPGEAGADGSFRYDVEAEDLDDDRTLRFSLVHAPAGMTIGAVSGRIEWRPLLEQTGSHDVEVVVEDLQGGHDSQHFELSVGVQSEPASLTPDPTTAGP